MHLFRLRYTALGLLTFLQLVTSSASSCSFNLNDNENEIAARTLASTVVFEGLAHREIAYKDDLYKVKFKVLRMAKGSLPREANNANRFRSVLVGDFGAKSDSKRCVANRNNVARSKKYLVFLNTSETSPRGSRSRASDGRKSPVAVNSAQKSHFSGADRLRVRPHVDLTHPPHPNYTYYLGAFPVLLPDGNDRFFEIATRNNCSACVREPRITKISPDRNILAGKKVRFHCRTTGYPIPFVSWLKNGHSVDDEHGKISIRMKNHTSILQIRKVTKEDSGAYQCHAINFVGESTMNRTRLMVSTDHEKVYQQRCQRTGWCFNGGTCYELSKISGSQYCECDGNYVGERCEEKNMGYNSIIRKKKRRSLHKKKMKFLFRSA